MVLPDHLRQMILVYRQGRYSKHDQHMNDRLITEIMKKKQGLCKSEKFMKEFNKHFDSNETIFGLEKEDFNSEEIAKITEEKYCHGCC